MDGMKSGTLYSEAARTAAQTGSVIDNTYGAQALIVSVHIPIDPGTAEVTFTIQGRVSVAAPWYTLLASAALTALADTTLTVDPRLTAAGNSIAKLPVPAQFRVNVGVADTQSVTYQVDYCLAN
jgi:hypothetical protein